MKWKYFPSLCTHLGGSLRPNWRLPSFSHWQSSPFSCSFTCSGIKLSEDWLPTPSTSAVICMHGWRSNSSLIGLVFSWHGLRLSPAEDPSGCAPHLPQHCPLRPPPSAPPHMHTHAPSHHARACCIPHDWTRPPGPRTPCSRRVNATARVCSDAAFSSTWNKHIRINSAKGGKKRAYLQYLALELTRCYVIVFLLLSLGSFHYSTSLPLAASSLFFLHIISSSSSRGWLVKKYPVNCHFCPLVWFFTLPPPQPSSPDKKEPLLRCFAGHYKMVAMDTQSEQAPHAGSRKNYKCSISCNLMEKIPQTECCVKR